MESEQRGSAESNIILFIIPPRKDYRDLRRIGTTVLSLGCCERRSNTVIAYSFSYSALSRFFRPPISLRCVMHNSEMRLSRFSSQPRTPSFSEIVRAPTSARRPIYSPGRPGSLCLAVLFALWPVVFPDTSPRLSGSQG